MKILAAVAPVMLPVTVWATPASAQPDSTPTGAQLVERLMEADTNHDGRVTRAEVLAARAAQFGKFDRNGDGAITMDDVPRMMRGLFESRFKALETQFDANHDGRVTREEFINGPTRGFDLADANHDGVVTSAEVDLVRARYKTAHR